MRANSVALTLVVLGASLAGGAPDAEARGRRSAGITFVPTATGSIRTAPAAQAAREEPAASLAMPRPVPPVAAPIGATPVKDVRTAQAWCGSGRLVGSGAGFCEIN